MEGKGKEGAVFRLTGKEKEEATRTMVGGHMGKRERRRLSAMHVKRAPMKRRERERRM